MDEYKEILQKKYPKAIQKAVKKVPYSWSQN
jgi:hypothetical protein